MIFSFNSGGEKLFANDLVLENQIEKPEKTAFKLADWFMK